MKNFLKLTAFFATLLSLGLVATSVLSIRPVSAQMPFGGNNVPITFCDYSGQFWIQVVNEFGQGSLPIISPYILPGRQVAGLASALVPCLKISPALGAPVVVGYGFQILFMVGTPF